MCAHSICIREYIYSIYVFLHMYVCNIHIYEFDIYDFVHVCIKLFEAHCIQAYAMYVPSLKKQKNICVRECIYLIYVFLHIYVCNIHIYDTYSYICMYAIYLYMNSYRQVLASLKHIAFKLM